MSLQRETYSRGGALGNRNQDDLVNVQGQAGVEDSGYFLEETYQKHGKVNFKKLLKHLSYRTGQVRDFFIERAPIFNKEVKSTGQSSSTLGSGSALAGPAVSFGYDSNSNTDATTSILSGGDSTTPSPVLTADNAWHQQTEGVLAGPFTGLMSNVIKSGVKERSGYRGQGSATLYMPSSEDLFADNHQLSNNLTFEELEPYDKIIDVEKIVWSADNLQEFQTNNLRHNNTVSFTMGGLNRFAKDGADIDRVRFTVRCNIPWVYNMSDEVPAPTTQFQGLTHTDLALTSGLSLTGESFWSINFLSLVGMEIKVRDNTGRGQYSQQSTGDNKYTHIFGYWKITPPDNVFHEEDVTDALIESHDHGMRLPVGFDFTVDLPFSTAKKGDTIVYWHYGRKYIFTFCASTTGIPHSSYELNNNAEWEKYFNKAVSQPESDGAVSDYSLGARKVFIGLGTSMPGDIGGQVNSKGFAHWQSNAYDGTTSGGPQEYIRSIFNDSIAYGNTGYPSTGWPSGMTYDAHGTDLSSGFPLFEVRNMLVYRAGKYRVEDIKEYRDEYQQVSLKKDRGSRVSRRRAYG